MLFTRDKFKLLHSTSNIWGFLMIIKHRTLWNSSHALGWKLQIRKSNFIFQDIFIEEILQIYFQISPFQSWTESISFIRIDSTSSAFCLLVSNQKCEFSVHSNSFFGCQLHDACNWENVNKLKIAGKNVQSKWTVHLNLI